MARTQYRIEYSDRMDHEEHPWEEIATSDSQGTANLLAKLWNDHIELDQWRAGARTRVVNTRTGAVVFNLTVRHLQPEPHPSIALIERYEHPLLAMADSESI